MSPDVSGSALLLVGVMLVRLVVTDVHQRYVRASMGPWLLVSGVLLALLGLVVLVRALRRPAATDQGPRHLDPHHDGHDAHDRHDHAHPGGDRVGWLLVAPVLALLLVAPPALGSFGVDRTSVRIGAGAAVWRPLPASAEPVEMRVLELDQRAADRAGQSLAGATVRLTGFVAAGGRPGGFRLARYQIACCAADAVAAVAEVRAVTGAPARDSWVTVTGRFAGVLPDGSPILEATGVQTVPEPRDPYE